MVVHPEFRGCSVVRLGGRRPFRVLLEVVIQNLCDCPLAAEVIPDGRNRRRILRQPCVLQLVDERIKPRVGHLLPSGIDKSAWVAEVAPQLRAELGI
jgi:hypothetical protein